MKLPPNTPPNAPPPNAPENKSTNQSNDDWDDALGDRKVQTVSPEMVRKLLEMNPALRAQGLNTHGAVAQAQQAHIRAAQGQRPPKAAAASGGDDIFAAFKSFESDLLAEQQRVASEISRLQQDSAKAKIAALDRVHHWLQSNDPNVSSPVTQQVIEQSKAFLDGIGFSVKAYVAERLKKR